MCGRVVGSWGDRAVGCSLISSAGSAVSGLL
jgi:hypothetical protein